MGLLQDTINRLDEMVNQDRPETPMQVLNRRVTALEAHITDLEERLREWDLRSKIV
jgi:polyhydroxyalkanoate synthesis regulator phasin